LTVRGSVATHPTSPLETSFVGLKPENPVIRTVGSHTPKVLLSLSGSRRDDCRKASRFGRTVTRASGAAIFP
ncbi:hypothetical protein B296_00024466, partial [Ensete ventricosum]